MSSRAEVGGSCVGRKVRPESIEDLLPLQPMPRRQGEQLHELGRAPLLPCLSGDPTSIDRDLEPTEDADLDAKHTQRITPHGVRGQGRKHHDDATLKRLPAAWQLGR